MIILITPVLSIQTFHKFYNFNVLFLSRITKQRLELLSVDLFLFQK